MKNEHDPSWGETQPSPIHKTQRLAHTLADNQHTSTTMSLFNFKGWSKWTSQVVWLWLYVCQVFWDYFCGILQNNIIWNMWSYISNVSIWNKHLKSSFWNAYKTCIYRFPFKIHLSETCIHRAVVKFNGGVFMNIGVMQPRYRNHCVRDDKCEHKIWEWWWSGPLNKNYEFKLVMSKMWFKLDTVGSAVRYDVMKLCTRSV